MVVGPVPDVIKTPSKPYHNGRDAVAHTKMFDWLRFPHQEEGTEVEKSGARGSHGLQSSKPHQAGTTKTSIGHASLRTGRHRTRKAVSQQREENVLQYSRNTLGSNRPNCICPSVFVSGHTARAEFEHSTLSPTSESSIRNCFAPFIIHVVLFMYS